MEEKILFVEPASIHPINPDGDEQKIRKNLSLSGLTIVGSLEEQGYNVDFVDLTAEGFENKIQINDNIQRIGLSDELIIQNISDNSPSALLISSRFANSQRTIDDLTYKVKKAYPKIPIIVGGTHATIKPDWHLETGNVDFVVVGEGEETTPRLLQGLKKGFSENIQGIAYRNKGKIIRTNKREKISNLDRHWALEKILFNEGKWRYDEASSRRNDLYAHLINPTWNRSFTMFYSKGCPTHCDYCTVTEKDGAKIRHMGSKRMFNDLQLLHEEFGVNIFSNQADTFGFSLEDRRFLEKVGEYRKTNKNIVLNNCNAFFARSFFQKGSYDIDEDFLELLAKGGFNVVTLAIETFDSKFNRKFNPDKITPEKVNSLCQEIKKKGMKSEIYMMYGFPKQNLSELLQDQRKIDLISSVDKISWLQYNIFPGTAYYRQGLREGWINEKIYRKNLEKGYFFDRVPEELNFSHIPEKEMDALKR